MAHYIEFCVTFRCVYVLDEIEDKIILYNTYIVDYAFTCKFNDIALASCTSVQQY